MNLYKIVVSEIKHDGGDQPGLKTMRKEYLITASTATNATEAVKQLHPEATVTYETLVQNV